MDKINSISKDCLHTNVELPERANRRMLAIIKTITNNT